MLYFMYHCTDNDFSLKQILFENRKVGDVGADCLLSVDGTDFRTRWINVNFWSYKFKKCGFRYEVALCIKTGWICWLNGPYAPGIWNDQMIFGDALAYELEEGERVEADDGYEPHAVMHHNMSSVLNALPMIPRERVCNKKLGAGTKLSTNVSNSGKF